MQKCLSTGSPETVDSTCRGRLAWEESGESSQEQGVEAGGQRLQGHGGDALAPMCRWHSPVLTLLQART